MSGQINKSSAAAGMADHGVTNDLEITLTYSKWHLNSYSHFHTVTLIVGDDSQKLVPLGRSLLM